MTVRIFDTDHHITPTKDFWTSRMGKKYGDMAPHVVDLPNGSEAWSFEGGAVLHLIGLENVGGDNPKRNSWKFRYENTSPSFYDPKERIKSMDVDGIDVALFFPSVAGHTSAIQDDDLYRECVRVYNDAAWDWAQAGDPKRMFPVAMMPNRDIEWAMDELKRVAKKGFIHYQFNGAPSGNETISQADDPFWATVQETGLVLTMHGSGGSGKKRHPEGTVHKPRPPADTGVPPVRDQEMIAAMRAAGLGAQNGLGQLLMNGVLERFPNLKISLVETSAGWLPGYLEQLDLVYQRERWTSGNDHLKMLPSEYAKKVLISVDRELQGIKYRYQIGVDNLTFGSDYPHIGNFWPHTRFYVDMLFNGVPEEEKEKILWSNAAKFYGVASPN